MRRREPGEQLIALAIATLGGVGFVVIVMLLVLIAGLKIGGRLMNLKSKIGACLNDQAKIAHKLWSVRLALFWGGVCGLYAAWPAFQETLPAWIFASASVAMCSTIAGARVMKQPGIE